MNTNATKQRYVETSVCSLRDGDIEGAERALRDAGYGTQLHREFDFLQVWRATDAEDDATADVFWENVDKIVKPFDCWAQGYAFNADPSELCECRSRGAEKLADAIQERARLELSEVRFVTALIAALWLACSDDEYRLLQYAIQRRGAPVEPGEALWVHGMMEQERAFEEQGYVDLFEPWDR
jgi:hypothetical protein